MEKTCALNSVFPNVLPDFNLENLERCGDGGRAANTASLGGRMVKL